MKRYAFILPRYFEHIAGGAETLTGALAQHLAGRGDTVEIWTTCAKDNRTWENVYPEETTLVDTIPVRRFAVDERDLDLWIPLQIRIAEGLRLTVDEQLDWMKHSVNSTPLYQYIAEHKDEFDALFFAPYLFGTTFWGSLLAAEKAVLIPCLHDEVYAYLDITAHMFHACRGALFNASPEQQIAKKLYGEIRGGEVGMGFIPPAKEHIDSIQPYFKEETPYFLYAGRKETGKNVHILIDGFIYAKERGSIPQQAKLVIIGGGDIADLHRPAAFERDDIVDLGHVTEQEKFQLMKHATAFVQPSVNESFSIVIMESWLLRTPVVVHGHCAVTRHHALKSKGGLYFTTKEDFAEGARRLISDKDLCRALGENGKAYVEEMYSWKAVLERFDNVMAGIFHADRGATVAQVE